MTDDSQFGTELLLFLLSFPLLGGEFLGLGATLGLNPATLYGVGLFTAGAGFGVAGRKLSSDDTAGQDTGFGVEWILFPVGLALVGNSALGLLVVGNVGVSVFGDAGRLLLGVSAGIMLSKLATSERPTTRAEPSRDG